jgi:hypothetical protein
MTGLRTRERQFVSLAVALSWAVSDADGGVTCVRRMLLGQIEPSPRSTACMPPCAPFLSEPWPGY